LPAVSVCSCLVRYESFCDIHAALTEVRFMPHSGRINAKAADLR